MFARVKQILENYIEYNAEVDIKDIKEITKKKDKTKIIIYIKSIVGFNELYVIENSHLYVYKYIYIIIIHDHIYIYDKNSNCIVDYSKCNKLFHFKYVRENNNDIVKLYDKNELIIIRICKKYENIYSYEYFGKIKNDKYKSNYKLFYICFVLYMPIELILPHIYI